MSDSVVHEPQAAVARVRDHHRQPAVQRHPQGGTAGPMWQCIHARRDDARGYVARCISLIGRELLA